MDCVLQSTELLKVWCISVRKQCIAVKTQQTADKLLALPERLNCLINKISRVLNGISIKKQTPYFQSASVIIEPKYLN